MRQTLLLGSGMLLLVFSGVVHGIWTDRWTAKEDLAEAKARLESIPLVLGDWQGETLEIDQKPKAGMAGMITRRYVQKGTGKTVTILVSCGRSGPASLHTPEMCYGGSGFEVEKPRVFRVPQGDFWTARLTKTKSDQRTQLRIFWAWTPNGQWQAPENPRITFAGQPLLCKLYVQREMNSGDDPLESDPCLEFMQSLLPTLQSTMFAS